MEDVEKAIWALVNGEDYDEVWSEYESYLDEVEAFAMTFEEYCEYDEEVLF